MTMQVGNGDVNLGLHRIERGVVVDPLTCLTASIDAWDIRNSASGTLRVIVIVTPNTRLDGTQSRTYRRPSRTLDLHHLLVPPDIPTSGHSDIPASRLMAMTSIRMA